MTSSAIRSAPRRIMAQAVLCGNLARFAASHAVGWLVVGTRGAKEAWRSMPCNPYAALHR